MTEQKAFNDPELRVILLLSGFVRELAEGNNYEDTICKYASLIIKFLDIDDDT